MPCKTNINIKNNKPDITVYDKKTGEILLIEIGITSLENLKEIESEKLNKYRLLAKELAIIHKNSVTVVPIVLTWDGLVTVFNKKYRNIIGMSDSTLAYIQESALKLTGEIGDMKNIYLWDNESETKFIF